MIHFIKITHNIQNLKVFDTNEKMAWLKSLYLCISKTKKQS